MPDRIEPPILMSRLMTFVFAASMVVLAVLFFTLYNMFPLSRPQVFFLMTQPRVQQTITVKELTPSEENYDIFVRTFIREYIKARNEVVPNSSEMYKKWNNDSDSVMRAWSSPEVYAEFQNTNMWTARMNDNPDFDLYCPVEFVGRAITPVAPNSNEYYVTFDYYCTDNNNNDRQPHKKNYTIRVKVDRLDSKKIKWQQGLTNPLGVYISEYSVQSDNGDPLDTGYLDD